MEPVALDPHCIEAPRDRQKPGHSRHGAVKRRVKAGHLRQFRMTLAVHLPGKRLLRHFPYQHVQRKLDTRRTAVDHQSICAQ